MTRVNKTKVNFNRLTEVIEEFDKKYSIRVGIIGDAAYQQHEHTNLTNADIGAIHEFGGVNEKTGTVIPERSFLRVPLLSNEGKRAIIKEVLSKNEAAAELAKNPTGDEADTVYREAVKKIANPEMIANQIGLAALQRVQEAFTNEGFGEWERTKEISRKHRHGDPEGPTLVDTGQLRDSITFEVKEV